jgi:hypothetical protein
VTKRSEGLEMCVWTSVIGGPTLKLTGARDKTRGSRLEAHGGQASAGKTEEDRGKDR